MWKEPPHRLRCKLEGLTAPRCAVAFISVESCCCHVLLNCCSMCTVLAGHCSEVSHSEPVVDDLLDVVVGQAPPLLVWWLDPLRWRRSLSCVTHSLEVRCNQNVIAVRPQDAHHDIPTRTMLVQVSITVYDRMQIPCRKMGYLRITRTSSRPILGVMALAVLSLNMG